MCMTEHSDVKRSGSTYKVFSPLSSFFLTRFLGFWSPCWLTFFLLSFLCVYCRSFWRTQSTFAACLARTGSRALRALAFWKASSPSRWATTSRATPCASPSVGCCSRISMTLLSGTPATRSATRRQLWLLKTLLLLLPRRCALSFAWHPENDLFFVLFFSFCVNQESDNEKPFFFSFCFFFLFPLTSLLLKSDHDGRSLSQINSQRRRKMPQENKKEKKDHHNGFDCLFETRGQTVCNNRNVIFFANEGMGRISGCTSLWGVKRRRNQRPQATLPPA